MTDDTESPNLTCCEKCGQPHTRCTAHRKSDGGPCKGMPITGMKVCRMHGGSARQVRNAAKRRTERARVNQSIEDFFRDRPDLVQDDPVPARALSDQLSRWVRRVTYLHAIVDGSDFEDLKQLDTSGKYERPAVWWELLRGSEQELRATAKVMDDARLGDRMVTLAEREGARLAACIRRILDRLDLSPEQAGAAPLVVSEELRELSRGAG